MPQYEAPGSPSRASKEEARCELGLIGPSEGRVHAFTTGPRAQNVLETRHRVNARSRRARYETPLQPGDAPAGRGPVRLRQTDMKRTFCASEELAPR
jgi:hypothetical protein